MCNDCRVKGRLYGIGLGPGDPGLLTVRAVEVLKKADSVIVPKGRHKGESVARDIISRAIGGDLPFVEIVFPMSRDWDVLESHWSDAADAVLSLLSNGRNVAFTTLGDVTLYSTFSYLQRAVLKKDPEIEIELIPGVSSIQLAAARFDVPLALGNENFAVSPLPENIGELDRLIRCNDNLVLMKIGERLPELKAYLDRNDLIGKSMFIRRAGFPDEVVCRDMSCLDEGEQGYLSIVFIRKGKSE